MVNPIKKCARRLFLAGFGLNKKNYTIDNGFVDLMVHAMTDQTNSFLFLRGEVPVNPKITRRRFTNGRTGAVRSTYD